MTVTSTDANTEEGKIVIAIDTIKLLVTQLHNKKFNTLAICEALRDLAETSGYVTLTSACIDVKRKSCLG